MGLEKLLEDTASDLKLRMLLGAGTSKLLMNDLKHYSNVDVTSEKKVLSDPPKNKPTSGGVSTTGASEVVADSHHEGGNSER